MLILIIFVVKIICNSSAFRVSSLCGHPGLPMGGALHQINSARIRFHDGEEVRYFCNDNFMTYPQKRKCVSGRWVGERARCGMPIDNDIEIVRVLNCTDSNSTNEILNLKLNQTSNTLRFLNSFHASRVRTGPITVYGSSCYLWQFKLKKPSMIPFLTLDFATQISNRDLKKISIKSIDTTSLAMDLLRVSPFVSSYRMCKSVNKVNHLNPDPNDNITYLLTAYHFRCDSTTESDYDRETNDKSDLITVETRADYPRDVNLVAVFLADHRNNPKTGRPECGTPETVQTGANFRQSSLGIPQYQYQCNDSFIDVTPNKPNNANSAHWYSVNCSVNGLWIGEFPSCVPNIQCPGLEYLEARKDPSIVIDSIDNVYFVNETYWVAGEYSHVNYACVNADRIEVGKLNRACLKDGKWSHKMPKCADYVKPESLNTVAQSPWTIVIVLSLILVLFLLFVMLFVRKYVSNIRRELTKNNSRQQTSIYTDIRNNSLNYNYDDCVSTYAAIDRINRPNKKDSPKQQYDAEYIELNDNIKEPLYTAILPPNQR